MRRLARAASALGLAAAAISLISLSPPPAAGHPFDLFGFGSRAIAMGGAYATLADDFTATYYNPAGLTRSKRIVFGMGYSAVFSNLEVNGEKFQLSDSDFSGVSGGISIGRDVAGHRIGLGLGFGMPDQAVLRARMLNVFQPRFILLTDRTERAEMIGAAAVEVFPWLSLGGGVAAAADLQGDTRLEASLFPQEVGGKLVLDLRNKLYPTAGVVVRPLENLRLGASYRGEVRIDVEIPMEVTVSLDGNPATSLPVSLLLAQTHYYSPAQVTLGASVDLKSSWTLAADLVWAHWSAGPTPIVNTGIELPESLGSVGPGYRDIWIPRLGVEYRIDGWERLGFALRAGYSFEPSPVPDQTGIANYLDNDKHTGSVGFGVSFLDPWGILLAPLTLDIHAQYVPFVERVAHKEDPNDPVGDLRFGGSRFAAGAILTFRAP